MKFFIGILAAIVAVFTGGCTLIFTGAGIYEWARGTSNAFMNFDAMVMIGLLPAVVSGAIAYACFSKPLDNGSERDD